MSQHQQLKSFPLVKCIPMNDYNPMTSFFAETKEDISRTFLIFLEGEETFYKLKDFSFYNLTTQLSENDTVTLISNIEPNLVFSFSLIPQRNRTFFDLLKKVYHFYRILTLDQEPKIELGPNDRSLVTYFGKQMTLDEFCQERRTNKVFVKRSQNSSAPLFVYECFTSLMSFDRKDGEKRFYFGNNNQPSIHETDIPNNLKDVLGLDYIEPIPRILRTHTAYFDQYQNYALILLTTTSIWDWSPHSLFALLADDGQYAPTYHISREIHEHLDRREKVVKTFTTDFHEAPIKNIKKINSIVNIQIYH